MFEKARIKLTLWYLVVIMLVSLSFSAFIYRGVSLELQRRFDIIEERLEIGRFGPRATAGQVRYFLDDLNAARKKVIIILAYTNGMIFVFSALAGFFLAGKTLDPIEKMVDDQKRFIADASHELRTPLTSLRTEIEVAQRDNKINLSQAKKLLTSNLDEVVRLQELSDNLLRLSRFETNGKSLDYVKVNLEDTVNAAIKKNVSLAKKKNIKITKKLIKITLMGNEQSLTELVSILVNNAIKYSDKGKSVQIELASDRKNAVLTVRDQGIGIDSKDIPHIFDRFYRADSSRCKTEVDGYGLGLSIAKKIVDLHGGSINVKSDINKGSKFTVRLPLVKYSKQFLNLAE